MDYSDRIKIILHKGKEIYYFDFSELRADEHPWLMEIGFNQALKTNPKKIRYISNVAKTRLNLESKEKASEIFDILKEKGIEYKGAVIGITGIQRLIVSAIDRDTYFTNSLEKAKDWLVEH
ncbi:hypothetical protein KO507_10455 [Gilvimarinus agarilyticus]|uniref:SpoIIAA-like n=1 Tax=Reichenbachiella agariperforans TaxID=156994 RepID=A0A1M6N1K0_REIAG|nr:MULTISPECIES: hypothetical protein [Reichenbachiella]MBU2886183.1 hypothetical protein [Gilvimarinus agarilyticus]MBU2915679.1 hypothetical protein [Reichenbachiella agariperforans]RJE72050.1 hypothetical protein BGP76_08210 [Reichenbachiella sp. MSK19-1]SHJ89516.1 hypothetical protein SAMN04488028_10254 [Reichenbachiella agariperforans]